MPPFDVIVIGGGVSGLAAAWELTRAGRGLSICVYDAAPVPGGKLASGVVAGHRVDIGAESMLARRPEGVGLIEEAGLGGGLTHPDVTAASVYSRGRLWPLPPRTLMGIPSDPETTRGLLTDAEVARIYAEPARPAPVSSDISVGDLVAGRLGPAVLDRLVEPLLAGVYAGHARQISAAASLPAFYAAAALGHGLVATATELARAAAADSRPVFAGYAGGLGLLAEHLAARLEAAGVEIHAGTHVEGVLPRPGGWSISSTSGGATEHTHCQAVVLAVPAAPSAQLLAPLVPAAAEVLAALDYASVALVTLALPREEMADLTGSGFLVPPGEDVTIKASTCSSVKWSWLVAAAPDLVVVRASFGRAGESEVLRHDDADLVRLARRDLAHVLGAALPAHVDAHVQRWESSLPQYAVGHLDRVAAVRDAIRGLPGLALAGAAYDGVGIPACIGSGRAAARAVLDHLSATQTHRGESAV